MKKRTALLATLFTFAIPAVADATIVINRGMFGVSLGDTMTQIRHTLGRPNEVDHHGGITTWFYDARSLSVDFSRNKRVHALLTISPSQRTASGVGAGSSETAVMRLVPGVHCSPGSQGDVDCTVTSGHVLTDFQVTTERGFVQSVLVTRTP